MSKVIQKQFGKNILDLAGGGAAGGTSAGLSGVFNAILKQGFELLAAQTKVYDKIKEMALSNLPWILNIFRRKSLTMHLHSVWLTSGGQLEIGRNNRSIARDSMLSLID